MSADKKLTELGITLPTPTAPRANFVTSVQTGNLLYLAGHGPIRDGSVPVVGQLGAELIKALAAQGEPVAASCLGVSRNGPECARDEHEMGTPLSAADE
jgi:hypothetical protein